MFAIFFPNIDPIALKLGGLSIRWYGIAYVLGIALGSYLMQKAEKKYKIVNLKSKEFDNLILYIMIAIIVGGRLGYIIFYVPNYIIEDFLEIFQIWHGGMSFHGGVIGVIITVSIFCLRYKKKFLAITDLIAYVAPIGIFFGRIANFINAELYGKKTDVDWGVIFPNTNFHPRHPSQLYEAFAEGLLLCLIMLVTIKFSNIRKYNGRISGIFLLFYSIFRIFIEYFREPDAHIGYIFNIFTLGQLLCIPMLLLGALLYNRKNLI